MMPAQRRFMLNRAGKTIITAHNWWKSIGLPAEVWAHMRGEFSVDEASKLELKPGVEVVSGDLLYDVFYGGYFPPEEFLKRSEEAADLNMALAKVRTYLDALERAAEEM